MKLLCTIMALVLVVLAAVTSMSELPEVEGVFGIAPVDSMTAFAVWIPLGDGETISGVTWYNNDGLITFPELKAVAGDPGQPELMSQAVTVAQNFQGLTQQWSDVQFGQPIASNCDGLYLIFRLPEGNGFTQHGSGGGPGFGYIIGDGTKRHWATSDGVSWKAFSDDFQIAVETVTVNNKAGNVLVLEKPGRVETVDLIPDVPETFEYSIVAVPNPFNPETEIRFSLKDLGRVKIDVYDIRGRLVVELKNEVLEAGQHTVKWSGRDKNGKGVASGVYMARLVSPRLSMTTRLVLVR